MSDFVSLPVDVETYQRIAAEAAACQVADYDEDESNPYARAAAHALALGPDDDLNINSADDVTDRLRTDMIAEGFEQDARKARLVRRTHLAAYAACAMFALPTPRRMRSSSERQALGQALNGDPGQVGKIGYSRTSNARPRCLVVPASVTSLAQPGNLGVGRSEEMQ